MKEVELTAELTKEQLEFFKNKFSKELQIVSSQKRFMLRFFKDNVDVRESLDIRYKWTNGAHELVVKKGALGSQSREESIVKLENRNQLDKFVKLLMWLGYKTGDAMYREIDRFISGNIEASLIDAYPYYCMEVEYLGPENKQLAIKNIETFFNSIGLKSLKKLEYQKLMRLKDKNSNLIFSLDKFPNPLINSDRWKKILENTLLS